MKPFFSSKRRMIDLVVLFFLNLIFYFLWQSIDFIILFSLGFIWNWVAKQDMSSFFEIKRYRFSTLKLVFNLQSLFLRPFGKAPNWLQWIVRCLPAGVLWWMVSFFNNSEVPWWSTFIGSVVFELLELEVNFIQRQKGSTV